MTIRTVGEAVAGRPLCRIGPERSLREACRAMRDADADALAVTEGDRLRGILCETDVIRRAVCEGRGMDGTTVAEIMSPDPCAIGSGQSIAAALAMMRESGVRHLPVLGPGATGRSVIGILSMRDIPTDYRMMADRFAEAQAGPRPLAERGIRVS
ncbi:cyclic nucleotide-binding/CBS domain-containing protein [Poseidonocella sp. HB161398]|uniref:CBS domain-containing protein n=1 Tax=Poseidonocella sp. HB161398 TaxID=2320855 RepID=UPI001109851C|nr:CBS domain-containing protein [Poseidonocella sp. HB161398]